MQRLLLAAGLPGRDLFRPGLTVFKASSFAILLPIALEPTQASLTAEAGRQPTWGMNANSRPFPHSQQIEDFT